MKPAIVERILRVMRNREQIRNIGVIAHIDHGKTTLTDLLLAEAGLIPYNLAGEARVLDYLEEERRRGITIKAANISLLHEVNGKEYVVNLIDTPGHVDFTGRVTRALRIVDGAIAIVDAVEEIMAQTEVVTRQALNELVKPVLFINKIDRLINELKLTVEEIQTKILRIIRDFNNIIELYCELPFKNKWKVSLSKENIILGSALHKWGLTIETARRKGIRFSDIIEEYKRGNLQNLQEVIPLHKTLLEIIVRELPNPIEAQKYRIPKIWRGNLNSEIGRAMLECDPNGPTSICVTNVKRESRDGLIATGRIFSGRIKDGDQVYLMGAKRDSVIRQVSIYMGSFREHVRQLDSGNIVALSGLETINAGETIINTMHKEYMTPFEEITYISKPVITVSVEPKDPRDLTRLINVLNLLSIEDPNLMVMINRETGEYLLSGIGELHLDIAIKTIKEYEDNLEIIVSKPIVSYRESVAKSGATVTAKSPNGLNRIVVKVEPAKRSLSKMIEKKRNEELIKNAERILNMDENENILVDLAGKELIYEDLESIINGFKWACRSGPLCGEPLMRVRVNLIDVHLSDKPEQKGQAQIMPAVRRAIFGSFLTANPILLEPIYSIQISAPTEQMGNIINLVTKRRGKISSIIQKGFISIIDGFMPVAESLGLADEIRSASSGRAFWQSVFSHWEEIPEDHLFKIIYFIRLRKGLPVEVPEAEIFID